MRSPHDLQTERPEGSTSAQATKGCLSVRSRRAPTVNVGSSSANRLSDKWDMSFHDFLALEAETDVIFSGFAVVAFRFGATLFLLLPKRCFSPPSGESEKVDRLDELRVACFMMVALEFNGPGDAVTNLKSQCLGSNRTADGAMIENSSPNINTPNNLEVLQFSLSVEDLLVTPTTIQTIIREHCA